MKGRTKWSNGIISILTAWMMISFTACGSDSPVDEKKPDTPDSPGKPTEDTEQVELIKGLESLKTLLKVDVEVNLLQGLTFGKAVELVKTELEFAGLLTTIADAKHFTPEYPGPCSLIFTVKKNDYTAEVKVDNLTIRPLEYKALEIKNMKLVEILPIIGQIEAGDKKAYEHIEHLRVAEVTRIRDMMWEYGAGNHSAEEYQQLMNRLNTGMTHEYPLGYSNFTLLGDVSWTAPSLHAQTLWSILDCLVKHASLVVVTGIEESQKSGEELLLEYVKSHPNSINIFGQSSSWDSDTKEEYDKVMSGYYMYPSTDEIEKIFKLYHSKNYLHFVAGTNIDTKKNKIYNGEYEADKYGMYSTASWANSDKNTQPGSHLMVTIATNQNGDIDQTNVDGESSKYPVGFANNVLFSGRGFPQHREGVIYGPSGRYTTSDTNYFNVALADLCFQMFAEVEDVDELLEMIRLTALTDYIRLDGQTQELQLMNPAGFFLKYLMPLNLPASIKTDETVALEKGYYHGTVFDIPGAEVLIDGQWIAYNDTHKDLILAQNPMASQWRLNGDLLRKMGYNQGDSVAGRILVVDDQWHGLSITKEFTLQIK